MRLACLLKRPPLVVNSPLSAANRQLEIKKKMEAAMGMKDSLAAYAPKSGSEAHGRLHLIVKSPHIPLTPPASLSLGSLLAGKFRPARVNSALHW
eukprot:513066-Prorocentrum_minimum.AAC.1